MNDAQEFLRFFHPNNHTLVSCRNDGTVWAQTVGEEWFLHSRKKEEISLEAWKALKRNFAATLPAWCREVSELPTMEELEEMTFDSICPTPTGDDVEPDGYGPDGAPSWLMALGLI